MLKDSGYPLNYTPVENHLDNKVITNVNVAKTNPTQNYTFAKL